MKRLVTHLQVFIEQFIAERGIEYGLQIVTWKFLNPPDCLYLKKSCKFLQSYKKKIAKCFDNCYFFSYFAGK